MANTSFSVINVANVYELASEISEHFKTLIDRCELAESDSLVTCVAQVLVHLEQAVLQRDEYLVLVDKQKEKIKELKKENHERSKQEMKYLSDIEYIDEAWRKENIQLSQYVQLLKKENNRLSSSLKSNEKFSYSLTDLKQDDASDKSDDEDISQPKDMIQNEIKNLNNRLNRMSKEIEVKNEEINSLKSQNDNLVNENQNFQVLLALRSSQKINTVSKYSKDGIKENDITKNDDKNSKQLESKIKELELELYKLKSLQESCDMLNSHNISVNDSGISEKSSTAELEVDEIAEEVDEGFAAVQGPIPKEPDEKLYYRSGTPNRSSRIWSFFKFFKK